MLRGSSVNSVAKIFGTLLGFVGSLLIGVYYSADVLGTIATISSLFTMLSILALLGNQSYILRIIPTTIETKGAAPAFKVFTRAAILVVTAGLVVILISKSVLQSTDDLFSTIDDYLILLFSLIIATALKKISLSALRALGDYRLYALFEVLPAALMLFTIITGIAISLGKVEFIYIYFTPHFVLAVLALYLTCREFKRRYSSGIQNSSRTIPNYAQMLAISLPLMGVNISNTVIAHTDILMLSTFTNESTVGIFSIYVKLSALMGLGIAATNSMFAPKASRLFDAGKIDELGKLAKQTSTLIFIFTLASLIVILMIHTLVLGFYGEEFFEHIFALYTLLLALLVNSMFGAVGVLLNMTGQQKYFFKIILCAAILNVILNYIFIPIYGPSGAATTTLVTIIFWNTMAMLRVKRIHGFVTFPVFSAVLYIFRK